MGVYIKNMQMPKSCDVCPFVHENDDLMSDDYRFLECGFPRLGMFVTDYIACRHPDCQFGEIPPHGDLIDRDALSNTIEQHYKHLKINRYDRDLLLHYLDVEMAPAIIPAEEVYSQFTDTAGNFHWCGTHSGEHTIKAKEGET